MAQRNNKRMLILWYLLIPFCINAQESYKGYPPTLQPVHKIPLALNPAYTGSDSVSRAFLSFQSLSQTNHTSYNVEYDWHFSTDFYNEKLNYGIGFIGDYAVAKNTTGFTITSALLLSRHYKKDRLTIIPAIQAGVLLRMQNDSLFFLQVPYAYDSIEPQNPRAYILRPTFSVGVLLKSSNGEIGLAIKHLNQPSFDFLTFIEPLPVPVHFTLHGKKSVYLSGSKAGSQLIPSFTLDFRWFLLKEPSNPTFKFHPLISPVTNFTLAYKRFFTELGTGITSHYHYLGKYYPPSQKATFFLKGLYFFVQHEIISNFKVAYTFRMEHPNPFFFSSLGGTSVYHTISLSVRFKRTKHDKG